MRKRQVERQSRLLGFLRLRPRPFSYERLPVEAKRGRCPGSVRPSGGGVAAAGSPPATLAILSPSFKAEVERAPNGGEVLGRCDVAARLLLHFEIVNPNRSPGTPTLRPRRCLHRAQLIRAQVAQILWISSVLQRSFYTRDP